MGGLFGVASRSDCVTDLFYGTDYHSHLGTRRGGLAVKDDDQFVRFIHDISNTQFKSKFEDDIRKMHGTTGIGVISDYEDQPLIIGSHLGTYAIVTVGAVKNARELAGQAFLKRTTHFSEMSGGEINPTELVATLINQESTFESGIQRAQDAINGSCSLLLLTNRGIYAARDKYGRTPIVIGKKQGSADQGSVDAHAYALTLETSAFPNLQFGIEKYLGPGEVVRVTSEGYEQLVKPGPRLQICGFLWVYYGYPASSYEGINVEIVRNRCGKYLAKADVTEVDYVAGIPDSGTAHAIGYATEAQIPFRRPFVKYTPTWPRSFMPQNQSIRDLVARMKLLPVRELIDGKRLLFCEDSIVRGTQLKEIIERLFSCGATEVHMRPACPPLIFSCKFLNFSRSKSELDLAGRRAIAALEGENPIAINQYADHKTRLYADMVERIREHLNLTSLKYQKLASLIEAIGLPKEQVCTYCWDGAEG